MDEPLLGIRFQESPHEVMEFRTSALHPEILADTRWSTPGDDFVLILPILEHPLQQRMLPPHQLTDDDPELPPITRETDPVLPSEEHLRCFVTLGTDPPCREFTRVRFQPNRDTEIRESDVPILIQKDIVWLDVSVQDVIPMQDFDREDQLRGIEPSTGFSNHRLLSRGGREDRGGGEGER